MSKIVGHGGLKLFPLIKTKPISTFGVTGICNIKGIAQIRYRYWLQFVQGSNLEVVQNSLEMSRKKNCSESYAKFKGKHHSRSLFLDKVGGFKLRLPFDNTR